MSWEDNLRLIEQNRDIHGAVAYIEAMEEKTLDIYLRVLFVLLDVLVDGQHTESECDFISSNLRRVYNEAKSKYSENAEYLFFVAMMIYISERHFEIEDIDEATSMLKEAMDACPENIVYKWGYFAITDQRIEVNTEIKFLLSKQILNDDSVVESIKQKGLPGEYLLGIIEATFEKTKNGITGNRLDKPYHIDPQSPNLK